MINHHAEITAQAQAYLEEVRAAAAAAHERLKAGVMLLRPQAQRDDFAPQATFEDEPMPETDPIFATRSFDVPAAAVAGLVDFEVNEL